MPGFVREKNPPLGWSQAEWKVREERWRLADSSFRFSGVGLGFRVQGSSCRLTTTEKTREGGREGERASTNEIDREFRVGRIYIK